jgi:hypothetical protein
MSEMFHPQWVVDQNVVEEYKDELVTTRRHGNVGGDLSSQVIFK